MHRVTRLPLVFLFLALAASWATASASAFTTTAETISGVLKARGGDGLPGAIECRSFAQPTRAIAAKVKSDGTFRITGLEAGHYELRGTAEAPGWGVAEVIAAAGAEGIEIELVRSFEVDGKVRTRLAKKALGEDLEVTVIGQPLREAAAATAASVNADGTFALDHLAEADALIYAITADGWISRPFRTKDGASGTLKPNLTLREGGRVTLKGRGDSLWTRYELSGMNDWMTRFYLGPDEIRTVTVPARQVEVSATACRREPTAAPGVDLSSSKALDVARGGLVDLSERDALDWSESTGDAIVAMVLLKGDEPLKAKKVEAALAKTFPGAEGPDPTEDSENGASDGVVTAIKLESGHLLGLAQTLVPMPMDEAVDGASASPYWPDGGEEAATHQSHLIVSCVGGTGDSVGMALELTQAVRAALALAGDRALGVLWGHGPAATNAKLFLKLTGDASREALPLMVWIRFQMVLTQDSPNRGLYTLGLSEFGLMEIEIPPCETPYEEVYDMAFGISQYLVSAGPVIADGDTIGGTPEQRIRVTYGPSMLDEDRAVYRIDLK